MVDWAMAAALGLNGIINGVTQAVVADKNLQANKEAQEQQMRLQQQQLDREIQAAQAQAEKEQRVTNANAEAMNAVFGDKKKKKQDNVFISDVQGLF